ncbi:hypothetical protein EZV62_001794 [Acer yangbiense]|uniref:Vacuolar ATPase assembly protein VMA22 n=1 Tax=Acer yangbiense TaxID=1000413 RepID=A0A5C7IVJ2_9ROSI|nr:hypothetical protein EZV62_001794 [Acer yangbiense]
MKSPSVYHSENGCGVRIHSPSVYRYEEGCAVWIHSPSVYRYEEGCAVWIHSPSMYHYEEGCAIWIHSPSVYRSEEGCAVSRNSPSVYRSEEWEGYVGFASGVALHWGRRPEVPPMQPVLSSKTGEITSLIGDFQVGHISLLKAESMMEEQQETRHTEIESEQENVLQEVQQPQQVKEENLLQFLDSVDGYLTLMDSLSSTLRQGWLELASAKHSMGASRISSVLLDLKIHSADTSVQVSQYDVDSMEAQPTFVLRKWACSDNGEHSSGEAKPREDKLQIVSDGLQLRNRSGSQLSEVITHICHDISSMSHSSLHLFCLCEEEKALATNGTPLTLDDEVQKKRSKSLLVFGALVSPRLRASQLSFETALETLVEIANMRSTLLSTFDRVHKELEVSKG